MGFFYANQQTVVAVKQVLLLRCDDHVAFGLAVVAHALHAVDLGQLVDDPAVFSVHGWEAVAPLWLFPLSVKEKSLCGSVAIFQ